LTEYLVVQLLSGFVGNPAGRQALLAAAQQSSGALQQAEHTGQQQQQQQFAVAGSVLSAVARCLQRIVDPCSSGSCEDSVAAAGAAEATRALAALRNADDNIS
jgi:hypothetical protein